MNNRLVSISICRVLGMIMIIVCHFGTAFGNAAIGQTFQAGVQLFLLISGYLCAIKNLNDRFGWVKRRFVRVCIPCYLWVVALTVANIILCNPFSPLYLLLVATNTEGYNHIFCFLPGIQSIPGCAHLWYVTSLMICYIFVAILKNRLSINWKISLIAGIVLSIPLGLIGVRIDYFIIFGVGYIFGKFEVRPNFRLFLSTFLLAALAVLSRLLMKKYCDVNGDNEFYLYVVIPFAYNALAMWIFVTIGFLREKTHRVKHEFKVLKQILYSLDSISFYVYITHYAFVDAPFSMVNVTNVKIVNIILTLVMVACFSVVLKYTYSILFRKAIKS